MLQFPPTKNTVLIAREQTWQQDFSRSTGSISHAWDIERSPSSAPGPGSRNLFIEN
jgi:hypothetical protein